MPFKGKLFVTTEGGQVAGANTEDKSSFIYEYDNEVYLPYDPEDNSLTSGRRLTAFSVTKAVDEMTPELYNIVCNGVKCTEVKIVLFRITKGSEEEYFYYILENARVVSVENYQPLTKIKANEDMPHLEKVKFLSTKFTWQHVEGVEYTEEAIK